MRLSGSRKLGDDWERDEENAIGDAKLRGRRFWDI